MGSGEQESNAERDASELDDAADREELRSRYEMLLQELRVVLPGVQVLMAFLLTTPFAQRFGDLDDVGRRAYLVSLVAALGSTICLMAPTVFHRVADRTARRARLVWGVRLAMVGMVLLALALVAATWGIVRLVFGTPEATIVAASAVGFLVIVWLLLPLSVGHPSRGRGSAWVSPGRRTAGTRRRRGPRPTPRSERWGR